MLIQILTHTPTWVFILFGVLLWLGLGQLRGGTVRLARVSVMPVAMTALAASGVASAFAGAGWPLLCWTLAAGLVLLAVMRRPLPAGTRYDAARRSFQLPGSAMPLALMMGIFFTKYAAGVALAMHPALARQAVVALGLSLLYGVFTGFFLGRAMRLWKLVWVSSQGVLPA